jgi:hypothetical protein
VTSSTLRFQLGQGFPIALLRQLEEHLRLVDAFALASPAVDIASRV